MSFVKLDKRTRLLIVPEREREPFQSRLPFVPVFFDFLELAQPVMALSLIGSGTKKFYASLAAMLFQ